MLGEDLTDFGTENSPGDTTEISHLVGANASVFAPNFNKLKERFEPVWVLLNALEDHHVVFATKDGCLALLIWDRLD